MKTPLFDQYKKLKELNLHKLVRAGNRVAVVNELLTPNKPKNETRNTLPPAKKV